MGRGLDLGLQAKMKPEICHMCPAAGLKQKPKEGLVWVKRGACLGFRIGSRERQAGELRTWESKLNGRVLAWRGSVLFPAPGQIQGSWERIQQRAAQVRARWGLPGGRCEPEDTALDGNHRQQAFQMLLVEDSRLRMEQVRR